MNNDLSENEYVAAQLIEQTATAEEIVEAMDISRSYVYDLIEGLRRKGVPVEQDNEGRYYVDEADGEHPSFVTQTRKAAGQKSAITRETKRLLAEIEFGLKQKLQKSEPAVADEIVQRDGGTTLMVHATDDHFGEHITNQHGDDVFTSDIAEERVRKARIQEPLRIADKHRSMGTDFDGAVLMMGGDHVTNDAIYEGQKEDTDETVREQIDRAASVYLDVIKAYADEFPHVKVACQVGNHGRIQGSSVNADGIVFSMLDKTVRESSLDNVTFMQSDRSYYIDFEARDYNVHLRHGHDSSLEHIGTSAGKQRWLSWLVDHQFDVAFRGHYHMYKEEPINGVPVHMGGSIVPQTEFEESHAISGRPVSAVHGATDTAPTKWTEKIYFHS